MTQPSSSSSRLRRWQPFDCALALQCPAVLPALGLPRLVFLQRESAKRNRAQVKARQAIAAMLATVCGWSSAAPVNQELEPPLCSATSVADAAPLHGIRLVSAGAITPGTALRQEASPGKACVAQHGNPNLCASKVAPGTAGVQLHRYKQWVCVVLPSKGKLHTHAGWIPESRWAQDRSVGPATWVGIWQNEQAKISVTAANGTLHFAGSAIWQGLMDPRFGSFEFDAAPDGDLVSLLGKCEVRIRRIGEFLFAQDNKQCGGLNVSFDGLYRFRGVKHGTPPGR
jgi:hypothetical protein